MLSQQLSRPQGPTVLLALYGPSTDPRPCVVARMMDKVDLQRPGQRLPETGNGTVSQLVRRFNTMLTRLETERGRSNARALAAQEAERHRIAQELHDEVGQSLTAVLLGLKAGADRGPR